MSWRPTLLVDKQLLSAAAAMPDMWKSLLHKSMMKSLPGLRNRRTGALTAHWLIFVGLLDPQVLKKAAIVQKAKTAEHTRTERQVLEHIRQSPFLVTLHYAFQTQTKLHLILGEHLGLKS